MGPYLIEGIIDSSGGNNVIVEKLSLLSSEKARAITEKEGNENKFFGDSDNPASYEEIVMINSLDKEKLLTAYVG